MLFIILSNSIESFSTMYSMLIEYGIISFSLNIFFLFSFIKKPRRSFSTPSIKDSDKIIALSLFIIGFTPVRDKDLLRKVPIA